MIHHCARSMIAHQFFKITNITVFQIQSTDISSAPDFIKELCSARCYPPMYLAFDKPLVFPQPNNVFASDLVERLQVQRLIQRPKCIGRFILSVYILDDNVIESVASQSAVNSRPPKESTSSFPSTAEE